MPSWISTPNSRGGRYAGLCSVLKPTHLDLRIMDVFISILGRNLKFYSNSFIKKKKLSKLLSDALATWGTAVAGTQAS